MSRRIELLAPAGSFEKLEIAIHYGADAVYLAGKDFSLRNFSGNFSALDMARAIQLAHANGVRVYVACNIYPRNSEIPAIADFLAGLKDIQPDAVIVADPGIFMLAREIIP
ncbi:MAG TPA: peptidase U32 family protein, partial [Desulfatirhabdiaceae bacterium]|nr:peptidase U32 family protein [Desulfatirhabdiaceae bacterium]